MSEKLITLAAMEKILKQGGAERVSDKSKIALKDALEDIAGQIAAKAVKFALHAGRKTIKSQDIKLSMK